MPKQFKRGDLVRLRSGGPPMTVSSVDGDEAAVIWFDERGRLHGIPEEMHISLDLLVPVSEAST
jgi:uncharacterized protein YodC (DUF2158 family)